MKRAHFSLLTQEEQLTCYKLEGHRYHMWQGNLHGSFQQADWRGDMGNQGFGDNATYCTSRITDGSGACFSYPTLFDGILYVRRGPALIAYNIKK